MDCNNTMRNKINTALKEALKSQDKRRISTLRLVSAAIKDRDIAARTNGSDGVSEDDILAILSTMIKQRRESIKAYEEGGRLELAQSEQEEIDIISGFLPQQLSDDQIATAVKDVICKVGAEGLRDMGRVMQTLKSEYANQMDFSKANKVVKETLSA